MKDVNFKGMMFGI